MAGPTKVSPDTPSSKLLPSFIGKRPKLQTLLSGLMSVLATNHYKDSTHDTLITLLSIYSHYKVEDVEAVYQCISHSQFNHRINELKTQFPVQDLPLVKHLRNSGLLQASAHQVFSQEIYDKADGITKETHNCSPLIIKLVTAALLPSYNRVHQYKTSRYIQNVHVAYDLFVNNMSSYGIFTDIPTEMNDIVFSTIHDIHAFLFYLATLPASTIVPLVPFHPQLMVDTGETHKL